MFPTLGELLLVIDNKTGDWRVKREQWFRQFFMKPAKDLSAIVGSLLDKWDTAFQDMGNVYDIFGSSGASAWKSKWATYRIALVEAFGECVNEGSYHATPKRALSRLTFFLREMYFLHRRTPFPTASVINVLAQGLTKASVGLADVSTI